MQIEAENAGLKEPQTISRPIRFMSYNVHSCVGLDGRYDPGRIAETIGRAEADIVGLQEADVHWGSRSNMEDSVQQLADRLGMYSFYAPIYELPPLNAGEPERKFGVALLSRFPIAFAANRPMSRLSTQERNPRPTLMPGLAETVIEVNGRRLTAIVVHLDYRQDPSVRKLQVGELLALLPEYPRETVVLGDFNARPDAPELMPLFARLRDTWTDAHPGDPGLTFPAGEPDRKIDYILASPDIKTVSATIVQSPASDHWPIVADLA
jgi:endonuclease/exonuclease/phosphatase family metal-dependent hydrolase